MIYIVPDSINKIVLTLTESSTLLSPYYLFEFENEFNNEIIYWSVPDESSSCRYNLFTLTENSSGSTTGGTSNNLSLVVGQYTYNVYESSIQTLEIAQTTGKVIETGRMVVASSDFIDNNNNSIYI